MPKILEKTKVSLPEDINASLRCNYEALKQKYTHLHGQYCTLLKQHLAVNRLILDAQLQHQTELRKIHENFKAFKVNLKRDLELKYGKAIGDLEDDGTNLSQLNLVVDHRFSSGTEHQEENETIDRETDPILPHLILQRTENTSIEAHEGIYPQEMNEKEFQFSPDRSLMPSGPNQMQDFVDEQCVKEGMWNSRERPFSCDVCPKTFSAHSTLVTHKRRIHNNQRPYKCEECGKKFRCRSHLIDHGRIHTGEKPYECEECGKKFSRHPYLIEHRTSHTVEKPFECEQCGKKFRVLRYLNNHRKTHTGVFPSEFEAGAKPWEKQHECEECGKKFRVQRYLNDHRKTHTQEKPFECEQCGKKFGVHQYLKNHRRTHTGVDHGRTSNGVFPYECEECGIRFERKRDLIPHKLSSSLHAGEKSHSCYVCSEAFYTSKALLRHKKRIHTGDRPYECAEERMENFEKDDNDQFVDTVEDVYEDSLEPHSCSHFEEQLERNSAGDFL